MSDVTRRAALAGAIAAITVPTHAQAIPVYAAKDVLVSIPGLKNALSATAQAPLGILFTDEEIKIRLSLLQEQLQNALFDYLGHRSPETATPDQIIQFIDDWLSEKTGLTKEQIAAMNEEEADDAIL